MNPQQQIRWATKALICLLALSTVVSAQTSRSGRTTRGTLALRPACPGVASAGDIYEATDRNPPLTAVCDPNKGWVSPGGGADPIANHGDRQDKNRWPAGPSHINDSGSAINVSEDFHAKGPNPYYDVTQYGARAFSATTTGRITRGTSVLTIGAPSGFINGDGITVRGAGAAETMSTPGAPTVVASNAASLVGTNITTVNRSGSTQYKYQIVAVDIGRGYTVASSATSILNGAATLGFNSVTASSWTRANRVVTVTTATNHNLTSGAQVLITGDQNIAGTWTVGSATPGTNTFTFTQGEDTRNGAPTSGGGGAVVGWYMTNHITWTPVGGAQEYLIYGRTSDSMALIGVSYPQNLAGNPLSFSFDDFGSTMTFAPQLPDWAPSTPPGTAKNDDLVTTITAGGGTTSLTLANQAANTVSGVTVKFDNVPGILAAMTAAGGNGVVYIPANSSSFNTNSVLTLPSTTSIMQAGTLQLGDTLFTGSGRLIWTGRPQTPQGIPAFGFSAYPNVNGAGAYPVIYTGLPVQLSYLNITTGANGLIFLQDESASIPSSSFERLNFSLGATDYTGHCMVIRNTLSGDSGFFFDYVDMIPNSGSDTNAPLFLHNGNSNTMSFSHIFLNKRGMYFSVGVQGYFDWIYEQGAFSPKIFLDGAGTTANNVIIRNSVEDTTQQPIVSYAAGSTGSISIQATSGLAGFPAVQGDGGMTVQFYTASVATDGVVGQNVGTESSLFQSFEVDGILSTQVATSAKKRFNAGLGFGPAYQAFVEALPQAPPTCAVSAGGTVGIGSYFFQVAPVFASSGSGVPSSKSATCTTSSGKQTITIAWVTVPGAIGYDLYVNGASFQCNSPWVKPGTATNYVWSGASGCGESAPSQAGTGPTYITAAGVGSPKFTLEGNGFRTDFTNPNNNANRALTWPDAGGTPGVFTAPPTNNDCLKAANVSGVITIADAGAPCGTVPVAFSMTIGTLAATATNGLGPAWVNGTQRGNENLTTVGSSGAQVNQAGNAAGYSAYQGQPFNTDQFAKWSVQTIDSSSSTLIEVLVNASLTPSVQTYYSYYCSHSKEGGSGILRLINAIPTTLVSQKSTVGCAAGDTIELRRFTRADGAAVLYAYHNGVLDSNLSPNPFTDSSTPLSGGAPGAELVQATTSSVRGINWTGGSFATTHGADSIYANQQYALSYNTLSNCNPGSSASPVACGAAPSGTVVVPTTTTSYTVNTTAVTANSRIIILPVTDNTGLTGAPACNAPPTPFIAYQSARVAGASFTFTLPSTTGTSCWNYSIQN